MKLNEPESEFKLKYENFCVFLSNAFNRLNEKKVPMIESDNSSDQGIALEFIGDVCEFPDCFVPRFEQFTVYFENLGVFTNAYARFSIVRFRSQYWIGVQSKNTDNAARAQDVLRWIYQLKTNTHNNALKQSVPIILLSNMELIGLTFLNQLCAGDLLSLEQTYVNSLVADWNSSVTAAAVEQQS